MAVLAVLICVEMASTLFLFSASKKVTRRFSEKCTFSCIIRYVNEYLFGLWGSKNKMFTNRKKSYSFRKKIVYSNKR